MVIKRAITNPKRAAIGIVVVAPSHICIVVHSPTARRDLHKKVHMRVGCLEHVKPKVAVSLDPCPSFPEEEGLPRQPVHRLALCQRQVVVVEGERIAVSRWLADDAR